METFTANMPGTPREPQQRFSSDIHVTRMPDVTGDTRHTCHECHIHVHEHLSVVDQRAGQLYLLFWNFLPVMKPEKGLMPMARLCVLRHQDIRGNDGLRGFSPCMEKGVKEPHRKAKQNLPAIICYLQ